MILREKNLSTGRKTCPTATLSITSLTRTDMTSNTGHRGERPAADRLLHGTVLLFCKCLHVKYRIETDGYTKKHVLFCKINAGTTAPPKNPTVLHKRTVILI
jgi:hypothetical protein